MDLIVLKPSNTSLSTLMLLLWIQYPSPPFPLPCSPIFTASPHLPHHWAFVISLALLSHRSLFISPFLYLFLSFLFNFSSLSLLLYVFSSLSLSLFISLPLYSLCISPSLILPPLVLYLLFLHLTPYTLHLTSYTHKLSEKLLRWKHLPFIFPIPNSAKPCSFFLFIFFLPIPIPIPILIPVLVPVPVPSPESCSFSLSLILFIFLPDHILFPSPASCPYPRSSPRW